MSVGTGATCLFRGRFAHRILALLTPITSSETSWQRAVDDPTADGSPEDCLAADEAQAGFWECHRFHPDMKIRILIYVFCLFFVNIS